VQKQLPCDCEAEIYAEKVEISKAKTTAGYKVIP
jgi:hypothetical protein